MVVKMKLKSDDWFKSFKPIKYPFVSPLGAAIFSILLSMRLISKPNCGCIRFSTVLINSAFYSPVPLSTRGNNENVFVAMT